jgi:hypothetical protein
MKKTGVLSASLSPVYLVLFFLLLNFPYQYGFRYLSFSGSVVVAFMDALLYTAILFVTTRHDLARVTLCFLALPYFIFIPGWLNLPTAIILLVIFIFCLRRTLQSTRAICHNSITGRDFVAFVLILIWVNVSGIGGYGFQWADYAINNARLHDLVVKAWPIRYGENQNFVYYFGYFLPSAMMGKIFTVDVAIRSVYVWAVLGITLALRWLSYLSKWRFSFSLVIIFILFGPIDILNVFYIKKNMAEILSVFVSDDMDTLTFTTSQQLKFYSTDQQKLFFLGNYPGNSFQLYWSPQQLIAGWLCAALMMFLFLQKNVRSFVFVYALLFLWAPLVMVALLPFVLGAFVFSKNRRELFTVENLLGGGSLAAVFVIFYLGGSMEANPAYWLFDAVDWRKNGDLLLVFYLAAWGIYALALIPFLLTGDMNTRVWSGILVCALAIFPLRIFGEWSDLLCRGSSALMFLLLVFLLRAVHDTWHRSQKMRAALLFCVLLPGMASALLINKVSLTYYGQTEAVRPLLSHKSIYPNFGPDDSLFNRLFRRALPEPMIDKSDRHE